MFLDIFQLILIAALTVLLMKAARDLKKKEKEIEELKRIIGAYKELSKGDKDLPDVKPLIDVEEIKEEEKDVDKNEETENA